MVNEYILSQLINENEKEVFKAMRDMRADMGTAKALLNDEQFNTFMRAATINQSILQDASFRRMNAMNQIVSSTFIDGRVLQNGYKDSDFNTQDSLTAADVDFGKAELKSTKLKAMCKLYDDDKEDNIEREAFEQTLLSMMGEAVGRDLEAVCVFGNDAYTSGGSADPLFSTFDGWLEQAKSYQVKSDGAKGAGTKDFDLDDGIDAMFDAMIGKLPVPYRAAGLMNRLAFYVPWEVYDAYQNLLASRVDTLGDVNLTGRPSLTYKNIPVKYAPVLDAADGRTVFGNVPSILTIPEYTWFGIYKDLSIEPRRDVPNELTEYYYRIRCAASLQFPDAFVTGVMTANEAAAVQADNKV
jgi:hypothetical protein